MSSNNDDQPSFQHTATKPNSEGMLSNDIPPRHQGHTAYQDINHHENYHRHSYRAPPIPYGMWHKPSQEDAAYQDMNHREHQLSTRPPASLSGSHCFPYPVISAQYNHPSMVNYSAYPPYEAPPVCHHPPYHQQQFAYHQETTKNVHTPMTLQGRKNLASEDHDVQNGIMLPTSRSQDSLVSRGVFSASTKASGGNEKPDDSSISAEYDTRDKSTEKNAAITSLVNSRASPKEVMGVQELHEALAVNVSDSHRTSYSGSQDNTGRQSESSSAVHNASLNLTASDGDRTPKSSFIFSGGGNTNKSCISDVTNPSTDCARNSRQVNSNFPKVPHDYLPHADNKIDIQHCRSVWSYAYILVPSLKDSAPPNSDDAPEFNDLRTNLRRAYVTVKKMIFDALIAESQEFCLEKGLNILDNYSAFSDLTKHLIDLCKLKDEDTSVLNKENLSIVLTVGLVFLTERTRWIEDIVEPKFAEHYRAEIDAKKNENFLHRILRYCSIGALTTLRKQMIARYGLAYYLRHPRSTSECFGKGAEVGVLQNVTVVCGDVHLNGHVYYIQGHKVIDVATSAAFHLGSKVMELLRSKERDNLDKYVNGIWGLVS